MANLNYKKVWVAGLYKVKWSVGINETQNLSNVNVLSEMKGVINPSIKVKRVNTLEPAGYELLATRALLKRVGNVTIKSECHCGFNIS